MKSFSSFLFLLLYLNINSVNAQNSLTEEQEEFIEIIKTILLDKEINKFLEDNGLFCMTEGKTIYILNENTSICDAGVIFFVMPEKFIRIRELDLNNNLATISFEFIEDKNKNIFKIEKYNLSKKGKWKIIS